MSDLRATNFKGRTSGSVPNMPDGVVVGSAVTISSSGIDVGAAGIITATTFSGTVSSSTGSFSGDVDIADKIVHTGDTNTAIRFPAADTFTVETAGSEAIRVDSSGDLGIGTASPGQKLHLSGGQALFNNGSDFYINSASAATVLDAKSGVLRFDMDGTERVRFDSTGDVEIGSGKYLTWVASGGGTHRGRIKCDSGDSIVFENTSGNSEAMRIDSSQRLLIGTNSSRSTAGTGADLQVETTDAGGRISVVQNRNDATACPFVVIGKSRGTSVGSNTVLQNNDRIGAIVFAGADGTDMGSDAARIIAEVDGTPGGNDMPGRLIFSTTADGSDSATERLRVDSSGRLLLGTTTPRTVADVTAFLQVEGTTFHSASQHLICNGSTPHLSFAMSGGSSDGSNTIVANNNTLGWIQFIGADGTDMQCSAASIQAQVDGTPGVDDMPGRLIFSTTNDGQSTPTERMRIDNLGNVTMATISGGQEALTINRATADGTLISFQQAGTAEGNIAVSGSTVSYNGAHLTRWSQFVGISTNVKSDRPTILRGSVLSNLDEMCEWGEEDNEQLNRMKVSDVEGDPKVAGVFQGYDDADEVYTNDFYCAMTGDFVIRIAQGTTVANGDLLMSAGDGTAKPQGDDIVRSKTIAKVTSTTKSVTYSDGSYCVPCVLMAC